MSLCQSYDMTGSETIARLAISLDEVKPPVHRRIEVPFAIRLDRLHRVLQIVIGWEGYQQAAMRTILRSLPTHRLGWLPPAVLAQGSAQRGDHYQQVRAARVRWPSRLASRT